MIILGLIFVCVLLNVFNSAPACELHVNSAGASHSGESVRPEQRLLWFCPEQGTAQGERWGPVTWWPGGRGRRGGSAGTEEPHGLRVVSPRRARNSSDPEPWERRHAGHRV